MAIVIEELQFKPGEWPEGIWGNPMEGVRIQVRRIDADIFSELRKPLTISTMELDRKTRQYVPVEKVDSDAFNDVVTNYIIQNFEGFIDKGRNPLEVNLENKKKLMKKPVLSEWVWAMANALEVADQKKTEEEGKNS